MGADSDRVAYPEVRMQFTSTRWQTVASVCCAAALVGACTSLPTLRAQAARCTGPAYAEFDFWLGDWDIAQRIRSASGWLEFPARTQVAKSPDGCLLVEHWSGEVQFFWEGMRRPQTIWGVSVRRFDPLTGAWSIHWMDERNPGFGSPHVGSFAGSRGEFVRAFEVDGRPRLTRIVFVRASTTQVDWELGTSTDGGTTWTTLWTMQMRRRGA